MERGEEEAFPLMLTAIRQAARRACAAAGKYCCAPWAVRMHRRPTHDIEDVSVHMLVSSRTWDAGLLAAVSLESSSGKSWQFFFHDDGTLDERMMERILGRFPDARVVRRGEADERARVFLAGHPKCLEHRGRHNLFLKFFDFAAWAPDERFIVLDSDVIFFRRPPEIMDWAESESQDYRYNEDTKEKFCIPRDYIERGLGTAPWPRFNSGLVLVPKRAINLDLAETLLAKFEETAHHPQFFEQTLYGLMGAAWGRGGALPPSYEINWGYFRRPGAVCRHYVGAFKHDLLFIEGAPLTLASLLAKKFARS